MTLQRCAPLALVLALTACGDDGDDSNVDAAPPDPCAPESTFTGEFIDWDSGTNGFLGVPGATFTLRSDPAKTDISNPNGRFDLGCIPRASDFVDITPMAGSDYIAGTIVVDPAVLQTQAMQSYRGLTMTRAADFGFSPSLAHVFVHIAGAPRTVTTSTLPEVLQHFDGTSWSAGNTGNDIYLGNIAVSATNELLVTGGNVTGPKTIPLAAGMFTYVTLVSR